MHDMVDVDLIEPMKEDNRFQIQPIDYEPAPRSSMQGPRGDRNFLFMDEQQDEIQYEQNRGLSLADDGVQEDMMIAEPRIGRSGELRDKKMMMNR